jgi:translation elongation factor EF-Tu-like GTPase
LRLVYPELRGVVAGMDHDSMRAADQLPDGAELALTAQRVLRLKGTIVVGRVECEELRLGDVVVAVGAGPICRGRVTNLEQFLRQPEFVLRGEEVAIMFSHWGDFELPQDVRLFRVERPGPT